jgi:glycosyltransferase involved in cell wall biosynthesis
MARAPDANRPLRIAMLGTLPPLKGISAYCRELASNVAAIPGVTVEFISFKSLYPAFLYPGGSSEDDTLPPPQIPTLHHRRRLRWWNPFSWMIEGLVSADLLHAQWWSWFLAPTFLVIIGLFKLRRKPVIVTLHNVVPHERSKIKVLLHNLVLRRADHYVVHSKANEEELCTHYGIERDRIHLIPHGTLPFTAPAPDARQGVRSRLQLHDDDTVMLLFGAIRPYKGLDTLLDAFKRISDQRPSLRLIVAGKAWMPWEQFQSRIDEMGLHDRVVSVTDFIPSNKVNDYFAAADLAVLPYRQFSSQTGVGMTALNLAKPLVVTNVGSLPDLVKNPRCCVPPDDPEALAQAILYATESQERLRELSTESSELAETFKFDRIAEQTVAMYREVLHSADAGMSRT